MRGQYFVTFLQAPLAAAAGYCPPLGPVFPPPQSLSNAVAFKSDLDKLQATLQNALISGNTSYGPVSPNDTYSIQVFSAKDARPLLDFNYRGTGVENSKEVNGDSIFSIGSTTKLITVYLLLLEAGYGVLGEPVTNYLPELAGKGAWDDITVGALAGFVGGTVSEGE
jgi:CubicO group peptidase (beta-lactamase class C family)